MTSIIPPPASGDTEATRQIFQRWLEVQEADFPLQDPNDKSWQNNVVRFVEEFVAPDVILHNVPVKKPGRDGWVDFMISLGNAYPDSQTTYDLVLVDGNLACAHWTYRATHRESLRDHEATGRKLKVCGMLADRIENGKIVEHWAVIDRLNWLQQLGAVDESVGL
mgnify:CR=1 FL=1